MLLGEDLVQLRVLCVDDEPLIRMLMADALSDMGLTPVEAGSGEEALELLGRDDFDLLITDIRMSGINGWQLAEHARDRLPNLPVVYVSGHAPAGESMAGSVYLPKPFTTYEFDSAIQRSLSWTGPT